VAKAGVLHLTKVASADLARHGIRVAAVQPGFINTNIFTSALAMSGEVEAQAKAVIAQMSTQAQPVARGGQGEDIARAVLFLASEEAAFVTGTSLIVDGVLPWGHATAGIRKVRAFLKCWKNSHLHREERLDLPLPFAQRI
jgi:NAD(P)-dependent dehydrogenase (short-subunit alcohol dehydrogenase family)